MRDIILAGFQCIQSSMKPSTQTVQTFPLYIMGTRSGAISTVNLNSDDRADSCEIY